MADITSIFGGDFIPPKEQTIASRPPEEQLIDAIAGAGYTPPSHVVFDGKIHRFSSDGRKKGDAGWYIAFDGKIKAGAFGCWKDDFTQSWRQDVGRTLTDMEQMAHAKQMRDARAAAAAERKRKQETAAGTVQEIWSHASEASDDHPYLQAKGVSSHGLRVSGDGRLVVPMIDGNGEISSLQYIPSEGDKQYHPGGSVAGCRYTIPGSGETEYIAEGYATAASIHEATGATVHVAFSAGQLSAVAEVIRQHYDGDLVIVADNDESGTGQEAAHKAATQNRARVITPPEPGMDANDYAQAGHDLTSLLNPPANDWLVPADEFAAQPAPLKWLIKGHIQCDALMMTHGPSGGGKTFVVLDQCLHIASDQPAWCGNKVHGGPVVYLAGEGHHGLRGRIAAWKQHHKAEHLNMWLSKAGTDLNTPEGYNRTRQALLSLPESPALIVVDTLHRFLQGDENSAQDTKTMLDACNGLQREFGCSVLLVHHTGVSEDSQHRARGSSAWRGALDIETSVVPADDTNPIQVVQRKSKDSELADPQAMELKTVYISGWFDEDGEQVGSAVAVPSAKSAPQKTDPKLSKYSADFLTAWRDSGGELLDGCQYVSRSAMKEWLRQHVTDSDRTIKNHLNRNRKGSMISVLLDSHTIQESGSGWIKLQDGNDAAAALLSGP